MTQFRNPTNTFSVGTLAVLAVIALAGCNRNTETASTAPLSTSEYPIPASTPEAQVTPATASLKVAVSLNPGIASKAAPNDVVFIFARAVQGPRMPLAIVRKQVKDLPATVILDDSLSMSPEMKLSSVPEVIVVARVSKSGMAGAHAGDLEGVSQPVKRGTEAVSLSIANVVTGNQ